MSFNIKSRKELDLSNIMNIFKTVGISSMNTTSIIHGIYNYLYNKYGDINIYNRKITIDDILDIDDKDFKKTRCIGEKRFNEFCMVKEFLKTGMIVQKEEPTIGIDISNTEDRTEYISLEDVTYYVSLNAIKRVLLSHIKELKEKDNEIREELDRMFPGIRASESMFSTYLLIESAHKITIDKDKLNRLKDLENISNGNSAKYFILKRVAEDMKIDLEDSFL